MPVLARYKYGIAGPYLVLLAPYRHHSSTRDNIVDLFELSMMVRGDRVAGRQDFFGEAALRYSRRGAVNQRPNLRAVGSGDDLCAFTIYDDHGSCQLSVAGCQFQVSSCEWLVIGLILTSPSSSDH